MNKTIIAILTVLLAVYTAQGDSPLSARGYGWQYEVASARSAGMGLSAISVSDNLSLDLTMPANWAGPRTARFGFSAFTSQQKVTDNSGSDVSDNAGIGGFGFAVPVASKIFLGFTISPVTSMDYRWRSTGTSPWSSTLVRRQGQGGLTQGLIGGSYKFNDQLNLGLAVRPIFGKVERLWKIDYPDGGGYSASETISDRFEGYGVSLSGRYQKNGWGAGAMINTPVSVSVQRMLVVAGGGLAQVDSTYDLKEKYDLPLDIGVGISRLIDHHLFAVDAAIHNWGDVNPPSIEGGKFKSNYRLSTGWEWVPDYRPFDPLWKVLTYRAGAYMANNYAVSGTNNQASKIALTAGLGIPYAKGKSRLDLAFEIGWAGDKSNDGAAERTLGFTVGFNHSEIWFLGRRERE